MFPNKSKMFKNKSESFKNIVMAIAIIIGGSWTVYTFWELDTAKRSKVEIEALNNSTFRQPVLQIELNLKEDHLKNDKHNYIAGHVSIKNIGKKNTILKFHDQNTVFSATEISFDDNGKIKEGKKYSQYPPKYSGYVIRIGDTEKIPFYLQVGKAGLYFVDFEVEAAAQNNNELDTGTNNLSWSSSIYLKVGS